MKVKIDIPDGKIGEWEIETFEVPKEDISQMLSLMKTGRHVPSGTYKRLRRNNVTVMSNTPDEIRDGMYFVRKATGSVLINGLGMGIIVKMLLEKSDVTDITIIEKSKDVIELVSDYYNDPRVTIINADCFEWKPPKGKRYNAVWHDIWDNICADNLPEMKKLHRKYRKRADYQESWCRGTCERQYKQDKLYYSYF